MSDHFANYRLLEALGAGSIGEVFRAIPAEGPPVALKRLAPEHLESTALRALFASEAEVARQVEHHLLLGAIDLGDHSGWPYFTMRLVSGPTLAEAPVPSGAKRQRLFQELGQALEHLHLMGYAHADLSPANILSSDEEGASWVLSDFSAATPFGHRQSAVRGTNAYMSPEQVQNHAMDQRSDVFSLAIVCWEVLAGQRLFARSAPHLSLTAVVREDAPDIVDLPKRANAVLAGALKKNPQGRPSSPVAFIEELLDSLD
jgi:serine/threonine protein kinase